MPQSRHAPTRGFTLLELLLALALFVLLAALAWPALQSQLVAAELPESASRMRSLLYLTRSSAMLEHRRHRIRFSPKARQPIVEFEPDPILEPGRFVPVNQDWAVDPPLLSDVEVHRVYPGRPAYMRPISPSEGEAADPLQVEQPLDEGVSAVESTQAKFQAAMSDGLGGQQAEVDELRPSIVFEADGSTDWSTLVLSRIKPSDELSEEEPQTWVVVDGRTGLAIIRDGVTQAQLDDPNFYVQREKLELPEETPIEDQTLEIANSQGEQAQGDGQSLQQDLDSLAGAAAADPSAMSQQAANQLPGAPDQLGQPQDPSAAQPTAEKDALQQLEEELANSNLTDAEKDEIRRNFQESESKQGQPKGKTH